MDTVNINKNGGPVFWGYKVDNNMLGVYEVGLYDSKKKIVYHWPIQNTGDNIPDHFQINLTPSLLLNHTLLYRSAIMDPSATGGNCTMHIIIMQDNVILKDEQYSRAVLQGKGNEARVFDGIKFI